MRVAAVALLFAGLTFDLDLDVPAGTALDWHRHWGRPVPTGGRGTVPAPVATPPVDPKGGTQAAPPSPVRDVPEPQECLYLNVYEHCRIVTHDIMKHVAVALPKSTGAVTLDEATGGGAQVDWNYPPEMPAELYWMAASAYLRGALHPEVQPWAETAALCVELGEPAWYATDVLNGLKLASKEQACEYIKTKLKALPKEAPRAPPTKDAKQAMLNRLAAVELAGAWPYSMDPTFARRTLALGVDAIPAIAACAKEAHPFLARNAAAVLAQIDDPKAVEAAMAVLKDTDDDVVRARLMLGMARRGEPAPAAELARAAESIDLPTRAIGLYGLGMLRDRSRAKTIEDLLAKADPKDLDLLWSAVPALGRMRAGRETLLDLEKRTNAKAKPSDAVRGRPGSTIPEDSLATWKILHQMCVIALGLAGDKRYADEIVARSKAKGIFDGWYPTVWFFLFEGLAATPAGATLLREKVLDARVGAPHLQMEALRTLAREKRVDDAWLRDRALDKGTPVPVRILSLQLLAASDPAGAKGACAKLVNEFATGKGDPDVVFAYLVTAAARIGGPMGALDAKDLVAATERAWEKRIFARREGVNSVDITAARITLVPPLVETLAIELGRLAAPAEALPVLRRILAPAKPVPGRAEAALAVGAIAGKEADALLVEALLNTDGWTRFCAYRALLKRGAPDHACDWIFGDVEHRRRPTEAYRKWLEGK